MAPSPGPAAAPSCSDSDQATTPEGIGLDLDLDLGAEHRHEVTSYDDVVNSQALLGASVVWPSMNSPTKVLEEQQYMDWSTVDPSATLDISSTQPAALTPASEQRPSLSDLGLWPPITTTTAENLAWQEQLASQSCQCRAAFAQLIPNARAALREPRLDAVLRVTTDVMRECEGIVGCEACSVNCTDLICIMAIFQEADACFEYVAKGDIDGVICVSIGSYEVEAAAGDEDAEQWRRMLATGLVRRAHRLLDSISARGQDMLRILDPACRLGRVNIDYLEAVIRNSRENLNHVMDGLK